MAAALSASREALTRWSDSLTPAERTELAAKARVSEERLTEVLDGRWTGTRDVQRVMKVLSPLEAAFVEFRHEARKLQPERQHEVLGVINAAVTLLEHSSFSGLPDAVRAALILEAEAGFGNPEQRERARATMEVQHAVLTLARTGGLHQISDSLQALIAPEDSK